MSLLNKSKMMAFDKWLRDRGCEILPKTNEYEVLRFKGKETGIIYTTGKTNGIYCDKAIIAFNFKKRWDGAPDNTVRKGSYHKEKLALIDRDGRDFFYCGNALNDDITLEHLIPLNQGGTNLISNMVLSHTKCNYDAGNKTIHEKVLMAITKTIK